MAVVARLCAVSRWNWWAGDECLDRRAKRVARACARRRGYSPKNANAMTATTNRRLEIQGGEITMDNELLYAEDRGAWRARLLARRTPKR